jgi:hypothetical protein
MARKQEAETILTGRLFSELVENWKLQQFEAFCNAPEIGDTWSKARAAKELHSYIENKCREILDE